MTRPRPAVLMLGVGALALAAGTMGIASAGSGMHVESVGSRPALQAAEPTPSATSSQAEQSAGADAGTPYRSIERRDATRLPRPDRAPRPVAIEIPAIGVRADIDVVGLDVRNQVEVPVDVNRTGWYRFSAKPGAAAGSIVIVGHRDGIDQGAGAFINLGALRPGDIITLRRADDRALAYEIVARESFAKSKAPLQELFSRGGRERLTLITCGGPFDPGTLGYTDNIVVTALPVDSGAELPETQ